MTVYTPNDAFTTSEIYDLSDLVQGGATGDANIPIKALADEANYVKNRLRRWEGVKAIAGNYSIDPVADLGQYLVVTVTANTTVILPDVTAVAIGSRFPIHASIAAIKAVSVLSQNNQPILDGSQFCLTWDTSVPGIYMHDAEKLILVAAGTHWIVESAIGNFYTYGDSYGARVQRGNTLLANGTIFNRADVPRLALIVAAGGTNVVSDATWLSNPEPAPTNKGFFSSGNGTSTLRIPDERGLSDKYLDLGRGLDFNRASNAAGEYEEEQVGKHDHTTHGQGGIFDGITAGLFWFLGVVGLDRTYTNNPGGANQFGRRTTPDTSMRTGFNTGLSNIVKNIGKIPLIKY